MAKEKINLQIKDENTFRDIVFNKLIKIESDLSVIKSALKSIIARDGEDAEKDMDYLDKTFNDEVEARGYEIIADIAAKFDVRIVNPDENKDQPGPD